MTRVQRSTRETAVDVRVTDAADAAIDTAEPFLDHMLRTFAHYSGMRLAIRARGDLRHHLVEDVAIALGEAARRTVPDACRRFGERTIPMDDALVQVAVDVGGRGYYGGRLPSALYDHWMRSFADAARATLHVRVLRGRDRHHVIEAAFKALGLALREARAEGGAPLTTKGNVTLEIAP